MGHRHLEAIWKTGRRLGFIVLAEFAIIYLVFGVLTPAGFFDLRTFVSVGLTEVGLFAFIYWLFGEQRQNREAEVVNLMEACNTFSHLKAYTFSVFPRPFKYTYYIVENTATKQYYKAPKYLEELVDRGVIDKEKECKNEDAMKALLEKNGSQPNDREPSFRELMDLKRRAPKKQTKLL